MIEKYIQALESLTNQNINSSDELEIWKGQAVNILTRIYSTNCEQIEQVKGIKYRAYPRFGSIGGGKSTSTGGGNNIDSCRNQAYGLTKAFINELETLGLPEPKVLKEHEKINITVNQNQHVKIDLDLFLSSLKDELTGKQLKEVQQILDTEENPNEKKSKIVEKLKSFGENVASNILASILTNPQIFG